jgi:hypothetical protein
MFPVRDMNLPDGPFYFSFLRIKTSDHNDNLSFFFFFFASSEVSKTPPSWAVGAETGAFIIF